MKLEPWNLKQTGKCDRNRKTTSRNDLIWIRKSKKPVLKRFDSNRFVEFYKILLYV